MSRCATYIDTLYLPATCSVNTLTALGNGSLHKIFENNIAFKKQDLKKYDSDNNVPVQIKPSKLNTLTYSNVCEFN